MSQSTSFVLLFVGLLLSAAGSHASCPLELRPPSVVVKYGDPISINCSTTETAFESIGWEAPKGGKNQQKVNHLIWSLKSLTNWSISPSCYFNGESGEQCEKTPDIVVYTFPETISISSESDRVRESEKLNITCDVPNIAPVQNLTVKWYKDDTFLLTRTFDGSEREPVAQSSILSFEAKRQDNGATFRCEAHLDLGLEELQLNVSSQEYNINVLFGPEVQCATKEFLEGQTLAETCLVTGNPVPTVTWLKNGQPTDPTAPLSREDAGQYEIEAEGAQLIREKLEVLVSYGPELSCPSTYTAQEHSPHNLTCTVEGYPQPNTTWYKDGEEVELPKYLTRSDAGQYIITASNNLLTVNLSLDITVLYPPSPIVELEDSEVEVGSTVRLKCSSTGKPRPKYSWDYYRTDNVEENNEDGVSYLLITNSSTHNMGLYKCHAWNDMGNVSATARVTVKGAKQECPIEVTPDRMVIQYQGRSEKATCKPMSNISSNVEKLYWQDQENNSTNNSISWSVDTHKDWNSKPECIGSFVGKGECRKRLNVILYKTPDSVSILPVGNISSVVEGREFELQCDITNVAPARNLAVQWLIGNETIGPFKGAVRVTNCPPEDNTNCNISATGSLLNVTSTISITLNRTHNGTDLRCEALLDLWPPQPPLTTMSSSFNITVNYKPVIDTQKLAKIVPVFRGYPEDLVCKADGHPPPKIVWLYSSDKGPHVSGDMLTVSEAGLYNCTATNEVDSIFFEVEVVLKEDYLPLIAGFVAVTVIAISIIFVFIYSIYYKNTKMRRYSLKNPKLSAHNSNVAQNGWDLQFPMTKLS
ncbi:hemicentin-1-like [Xyrichtys novacula]|uniref:Hemicentin-1-like n=1 Tax=Xyrichtys novacula TaxID=13765 RepID=A0AAV1GP50_XYRNO|nr:hemicentin-1-like [Xyrichtys novacula]